MSEKKTIIVQIRFQKEEDGRDIALAPAYPGAIQYGKSKEDARERLRTLLGETFLKNMGFVFHDEAP